MSAKQTVIRYMCLLSINMAIATPLYTQMCAFCSNERITSYEKKRIYILMIKSKQVDFLIFYKKKLWNHSPVARVPAAFLVLPNFHECFFNSIETQRRFKI